MMKTISVATAGLALALAGPVCAQSDQAEEAAVRAALEHYLLGHATGDGSHHAAVFHEVADLYWVRDGRLSTRSSEEYIAGASGSPAEDEAQRHRTIAMVDVTGNTAVARIELDYPNAFITDYMSLLKIGGEWRIVNKIFHVEEKGASDRPAAASGQDDQTSAATRAGPTPHPVDVSSPEAIVAAAYEGIARRPGEDFNWNREVPLYLPSARLYPNTEQTGGEFRPMSVEEFRRWVDETHAEYLATGQEDRGFQEEQIHAVVHRYGDIAHVMSTYQKHFWGSDEILGRGINSFQLVHQDGRWWIASIAWDEETGAGPIPAEYLPAAQQ